MSFSPIFLQAASSAAGATGQPDMMGGTFGMLVSLILVFVIMYFFMIRPQAKRQKETQKMINALKKGDKVVTVGGIHGTVTSAKESTIILKVDDNTKIEFNRTAIASVENVAPAEKSNSEVK